MTELRQHGLLDLDPLAGERREGAVEGAVEIGLERVEGGRAEHADPKPGDLVVGTKERGA